MGTFKTIKEQYPLGFYVENIRCLFDITTPVAEEIVNCLIRANRIKEAKKGKISFYKWLK